MQRVDRRAVRRQKARRQGLPPVADALPPERSVLVVEADPEVQVELARSLRRRGLRVVGTSSGDGALALVREWAVDLVLVSDDLPGRAGVEVAGLVRQACPGAQVVVMSATVKPDVCEAARLAGAVGCVVKPLQLESLARWLGQAVSPLASAHAVAE